jgi:methyltransferase, FkbM family
MFKCITECNVKELTAYRIYVYGAGVFAGVISGWLSKAGIDVKAYIVDDEYFSGKRIPAKNIIPLSKYKIMEGKTDIVINGIANVSGIRKTCASGIFKDFRIIYEPDACWQYEQVYFDQHKKEIEEVEKMFADEESIRIMRAFLRAKSGEVKGVNDDISLASEEKTYFNNLTEDKSAGAYIDCGAFDGDSVQEFLNFYNNQCEVFAFESDENNYCILEERFSAMDYVHCINKGVWNKQDLLVFALWGSMGSGMVTNAAENRTGTAKKEVAVTDIDSVGGETKVGFIKMDIEGCEYEGLQGAAATIKRDYPVLAVSAYHKKEDLIVLPQYIKSLESDVGYKLYLRHHGVCAYELVLYAIPYCKS